MAEDNDINKNKDQDWYKALSPEQQKQIDSYWTNQQYQTVDVGNGRQALISNSKGQNPSAFVADNGAQQQLFTPQANQQGGPGGVAYTPSLYQQIQAAGSTPKAPIGAGAGLAVPASPVMTQAPQYNANQNLGNDNAAASVVTATPLTTTQSSPYAPQPGQVVPQSSPYTTGQVPDTSPPSNWAQRLDQSLAMPTEFNRKRHPRYDAYNSPAVNPNVPQPNTSTPALQEILRKILGQQGSNRQF